MTTRKLTRWVAGVAAAALGFTGMEFAATSASAAGTCTIGTSTIAQCFPDANLAKAVAATMRKSVSQPLTQADITNTITLAADKASISNLQGIQNLTNLVALRLDQNQISDISPLANLTKLGSLYLDQNQISDISPLKNLTNLTWLYLSGNTISNLQGIQNLTNLNRVYLSSNTISNLSPLANLTKLTLLRLTSNTISNLSPLANLTRLTDLNLGSNTISDVAPLKNLTALDDLVLASNHVSDVSPLAGLTNLTTFDFSAQSVLLPKVSGSSVSVSTATRVDGSRVAPVSMSPASGVYNASTGKVTWNALAGAGNAVFKTSTTVTLGAASGTYDVTFTQPYDAPVTSHTVAFDSQGGSAVASQNVANGKTAVKPADPTKTGFTFNGWNTKADGSGIAYNFSTPVTGDLTLYAQWKAGDPGAGNDSGSLADTGSSIGRPLGVAGVLVLLAACILLTRRIRHTR